MRPILCHVHGLNSSHTSFAYMAKELKSAAKINYKSTQPLADSIIQVSKQLPKKGPLVLVGHSLGGVIAMQLAILGMHDIQKVITISSPLGGSRFAAYMRWIAPGMPILNDIAPFSTAIQLFQEAEPVCPVLSIISTAGHLPMVSFELNDGVVTISSQKALPYAKKIEVKANHFEVLMCDKTIEAIKKFANDV